MNLSVRKTRLAVWTFAVAAGLLQAWGSRFYIEPDGVNYLDIASAYLQHDWKAALNGYWSPLYSWLLALMQWLFHPSPYWESTFLHLLNFAACLLALACFEFFFRRLLSFLGAHFVDAVGDQGLPEWAWWILGYTAFLIAALRLITVGNDTPDMILAALLFLVTGLLVELAQRPRNSLSHIALGITLGVAYLAKSVMFPLSFLFIATNVFAAEGLKRPNARGLLTLAAFLFVSSPFVIALSRAKGHLTFGETGKVAYFDQVTRPSGKLIHPTRAISDAPPVYEYAAPIAATFPPWYDPSYWYEGATLRFDVRDQLRATARAIGGYLHILSEEKEWVGGWLVLAIFAGDWSALAKRALRLWFLWLPFVGALALYSLVLVETRYVAVAMAVIWLTAFASLAWSRINAAKRLGAAVILAIGITTSVGLVREVMPDLAACFHRAPHVQWIVANRLLSANLAQGERVAVLGHTNIADYWAHLAGFRIVADVPLENVAEYWMASPEKRAAISVSLKAVGVKAIVTPAAPLVPAGWQPLGATGYYVQILSSPMDPEPSQTK